jgi:hypothetical protein
MPPLRSSHARPFSRRLSQWICGLHGHDTRLEIQADRLALRCIHCDYDSPGWTLRRPPAAPATPAEETLLTPSSAPASASAR